MDLIGINRRVDPRAEAVLTVAHGISWIFAANLAIKAGLPLHLIVHDDPTSSARSDTERSLVERAFSEVYRRAASRFCVSPGMADLYKRRYGVAGTVLYPSRARSTPVLPVKLPCQDKKQGELIIGYAGTLTQPGYLKSLSRLSRHLADISAKLLLIGPIRRADLRSAGLLMERVILEGPLPADELVHRLHSLADILLLPSSFRPMDAVAMQTLFPSKVVDYFATGLPCLVWAPADSSIARWICSEPGTAELVTTDDARQVIWKISEMNKNPERAVAMARRAAAIGAKYFSSEAAEDVFLSSVTRANSHYGLRASYDLRQVTHAS
jgi:glycosyltransferase involved in cell wall biosynthesis